VAVRVTVDRSGNVINETFDELGPSPYFARISMQAARKWKFNPAEDRSRQWVLRFEFSREGTEGHAVKGRSR
jgi:TonB family protein